MTERDPIEQQLMLARTAAWAPEAAKARVRARLPSGALLPAASSARGGVTKLTTALLVGAGFVGGYWLGFQRAAEPREMAAASTALEQTTAADPAGFEANGLEQRTVAAPDSPGPVAMARAAAADDTGASRLEREEAARRAAPLDVAPRARTTAQRQGPRRHRAAGTQHDRATPGRAALVRAPNASSDPAADELALLSRAERAIRAGEPLLARSFLTELDQRFPRSAMLEERAAAQLLVECALSNPGARRRAELFLSERTASVYTDRVRRSCGLDTSAAPGAEVADGSPKSGH